MCTTLSSRAMDKGVPPVLLCRVQSSRGAQQLGDSDVGKEGDQYVPQCYNMPNQGRTDHCSTWALPEGPGSVSRGPHEMPLVPLIGCFGCGLSVGEHRGPMSCQSTPVP
ncbi:unnamed protein product, partial [Staurois parvus]